MIEYKQPEEFVTEQSKLDALTQAGSVATQFGCKIIIATDGTEFIWAISKDVAPYYEIIKNEDDDYPFTEKVDFINPANHEETLKTFNYVKSNLVGNYIKIPTTVNPSTLASSIWQINWISTNCPPEKALSTFIELFIFKYISDLGVLKTNNDGDDCSFNYVMNKPENSCLKYYFKTVRPYIKTLFPPNYSELNQENIIDLIFDSTTVINGFTLDKDKEEDNRTFHLMLEKFHAFGLLNNIDKEFKTRLFEDFLKDTDTIKTKGQFFTPRNVIKAIVEMAQVDNLQDGASVCDPACGVGGFILETMYKRKFKDIYVDNNDKNKFKSKINYFGYDICDNNNNTNSLTIILAKANFLIYVSDILGQNPYSTKELAGLVNNMFFSYKNAMLGSLSEIYHDKYDLVITNPPYVTSGSGLTKKELSKVSGLLYKEENGNVVSDGYKILGKGKESLFLEKIIKELKPNGKAFVVIPDGCFSRIHDVNIRKYIMDKCIIEAIISLPANTFYTTAQKTYILVIKKRSEVKKTNEKIFTYIVKSIGEKLDARRYLTPKNNDLIDMQRQYKYFISDKESYENNSNNIHIFDEELFLKNINNTWIPEKFFPKEKQIAIGYVEEVVEKNSLNLLSSLDRLQNLISTEKFSNLGNIDISEFKTTKMNITNIFSFIDVGDDKHNGKKIHQKELEFEELDKQGVKYEKYPLFSGRTDNEGIAGYLDTYDYDFSRRIKCVDNFGNLIFRTSECLTWVVDGKAGKVFHRSKLKFSMNNHCGVLAVNPDYEDKIFLPYFSLILPKIFSKYVAGEGGNKRLKLNQIKKVEVEYIQNYNEQVKCYEYLKKIADIEEKIKQFVDNNF